MTCMYRINYYITAPPLADKNIKSEKDTGVCIVEQTVTQLTYCIKSELSLQVKMQNRLQPFNMLRRY